MVKVIWRDFFLTDPRRDQLPIQFKIVPGKVARVCGIDFFALPVKDHWFAFVNEKCIRHLCIEKDLETIEREIRIELDSPEFFCRW